MWKLYGGGKVICPRGSDAAGYMDFCSVCEKCCCRLRHDFQYNMSVHH